jgi:hypothetical protein
VKLNLPTKVLAAVLSFSLAFSQCTKIKTTDIGTELLPAVDNVFTFDTSLSVVTTNFLFGDSAVPFSGRDGTGRVAEFLMGSISNDPQFGESQGSMFFELKPPGFPYAFENVKDSLSLDSAVLCVKWNSTWGDTSALQTVRVFELLSTMNPDSLYRTNASFRFRDQIGQKTFQPLELNDSLVLFRERLANQLRIRLSDEFGQRLLAQDSSVGAPYHSDSAFRAFFKGFAVVPDAPGAGNPANALMAFILSDTNTHLKLYYKVVKNGRTDTSSREWVFNNISPGGLANRIDRKYDGSQLASHLSQPADGDSLAYIQASPGTYTIIKLPALEQFRNTKGNVIVHLAELTMTQVPGSPLEQDNNFAAPPAIYMDFLDTVLNRQFPFLTDALQSGRYEPRVFGGLQEYRTAPNGQLVSSYNLYVTRYIQNFITRKAPNFPFYLYAPFNVVYPELRLFFGVTPMARGRVKLGGGRHSSQPMKLRIIYSTI